MNKQFSSMQEFNQFMQSSYLLKRIQYAAQMAMRVLMIAIAEECKRQFGQQHAEWAPLSDATMKDRERQGFEPNNPLYRTGNLMESVEVVTDGNEGIVGSKDPIMAYQELGTSSTGWGKGIPPRPVFSLVALQMWNEMPRIFAAAFVENLSR